jgi:hypothetical protein
MVIVMTRTGHIGLTETQLRYSATTGLTKVLHLDLRGSAILSAMNSCYAEAWCKLEDLVTTLLCALAGRSQSSSQNPQAYSLSAIEDFTRDIALETN